MKTIRVVFIPDTKPEKFSGKFNVELPLELFLAAVRGGYDVTANTLAVGVDLWEAEKILQDYAKEHFGDDEKRLDEYAKKMEATA